MFEQMIGRSYGIMQEKILQMLRQSEGYLSGEQLSQELGVSRAAVWKVIQALRQEGYQINSSTNKGYRLASIPDIVTPSEIKNGLNTHQLGHHVVFLNEVDSTNEEAKRQGTAGAPHGTLCLAERQTDGKGRLGRNWVSTPGDGVWMSLLLRPNLAPFEVTQITLLAGLATCRAIRSLTGCDALIKWPNDIVIGGRKVVGILTEMAAQAECIDYLVVGIGINVNHSKFPEELAQKATSLSMETGKKWTRSRLVQEVLVEMEDLYDSFLTEMTSAFLDDYRKLCVSLGKQVRVQRGSTTLQGTAIDINTRGELIIKTSQGQQATINSGEVSVQGIYGV